jgi:hypothetical protein
MFTHVPHPHVQARKEQGPVKVADQHKTDTEYARFNRSFAVWCTNAVGSMTCAYLFAALALISLPAAILSGSVIIIVAWIAQTFFQLVLLSVIMVGQNVASEASDARSVQTYNDAEAILHAAEQIAAHLTEQDTALTKLVNNLEAKE